jgi:hypothetical protein
MYRVFVTAIFASLLLLAGCTEKKEAKTQDENIRTIEAVLQNSLTGPSDELNQILESEKLEDLVKYEEKLYKEYFANDDSYLAFVNKNTSTMMIEVKRNQYKTKVNHINYEKVDEKDNVYNFSVELEFQKENSENAKVEIVTGQANLNEEHKIENIIIRYEKLWRTLFSE